jgi:hypothetical protein
VGTIRTSSRRLRTIIEIGVEKDVVLLESPILEPVLEKKTRARMAFVVRRCVMEKGNETQDSPLLDDRERSS